MSKVEILQQRVLTFSSFIVDLFDQVIIHLDVALHKGASPPTHQNGQTHSNNSSAICRRIV